MTIIKNTTDKSTGYELKKRTGKEKIIALAGNPNVGKSTVFNALTGMKQHTGNWPGKTVGCTEGYCKNKKYPFIFVDIPGTYSLMAHSQEEEVARDFICFEAPDEIVAVCDATCLERNLNLVLQICEITDNVILCVNLMDEAERKDISIDIPKLSEMLGIPVIPTEARKKHGLKNLLEEISRHEKTKSYKVKYPDEIETAISMIEDAIPLKSGRWLALKLIEDDKTFMEEILKRNEFSYINSEKVKNAVSEARKYLSEKGFNKENLKDNIVYSIVRTAELISKSVVKYNRKEYTTSDRRLDNLFTGRATGYPVMIMLLALTFWLTISGANYPSALLSSAFIKIQDMLSLLFLKVHCPIWLHDMIILGVLRVLFWVVSVMLPPMAIFFPMFTLLEDSGYLPRVAFNLDKPFKKCGACGKQALTMCMGFGCNAAGTIGCRIIDSKRERLLAILTNSLVPCNGKFSALITVIIIFFAEASGGVTSTAVCALILTLVIIVGVILTFISTGILSKTLLKGENSSYILEMPPFRKPQIGKVIVRSVLDRTLFVLGRAVVVAAPAGLVIWLAANITAGGESLLKICAGFLDPAGRLMGVDGIILMGFILGLPANEIIIPVILMAYASGGYLPDSGSISSTAAILSANGWTVHTAVSMIILLLLHSPCTTTLLTVKKETGSMKWTLISALIPTLLGIILCIGYTAIINIS